MIAAARTRAASPGPVLHRVIGFVFHAVAPRGATTTFLADFNQDRSATTGSGIMPRTPALTRINRCDVAQRAAPAAFHRDDLTFLRGSGDPLLTFTEGTAINVPTAGRAG